MIEHQVQTISLCRKGGEVARVSDNLVNIQQVEVQIVEITPLIVLSQNFFDEAWSIWNKI